MVFGLGRSKKNSDEAGTSTGRGKGKVKGNNPLPVRAPLVPSQAREPPPYEPPANRDYSVPVIDIWADRRWCSWGHYQMWYLLWKSRKCWPDEEIQISSLTGATLTRTVEVRDRRHLKTMMEAKYDRNMSMVWEFYAYLAKERNTPEKVWIRGVRMTFDVRIFNDLLDLPEDWSRNYHSYKHLIEDKTYQDKCRYLFVDMDRLPDWPHQPHFCHLKSEFEALQDSTSMWLHPTSNTSEFHPARYTMLHRLVSDEDINIGGFIFNKIWEASRKVDKRALMPYPGLLTKWFTRCEVPKLDGDDTDDEHGVKNYERKQKKQGQLKRSRTRGPGVELPQHTFAQQEDPFTDVPFVPDHDQTRDYAMAGGQVHIMDTLCRMMAGSGVESSHFSYSGYPHGAYRQDYPGCFAPDATNYIHAPGLSPCNREPLIPLTTLRLHVFSLAP